MNRKYRAIDLFAGIGGIRMGFDRAFGEEAIETVFVSEWDTHAQKPIKLTLMTALTLPVILHRLMKGMCRHSIFVWLAFRVKHLALPDREKDLKMTIKENVVEHCS